MADTPSSPMSSSPVAARSPATEAEDASATLGEGDSSTAPSRTVERMTLSGLPTLLRHQDLKIHGRQRRFSDPGPSSQQGAHVTRTVTLESLVEGSAVPTPRSVRTQFVNCQSFDYAGGQQLPKKVVELTKVGPDNVDKPVVTECLDKAQRKSLLKWTLAIIIALIVGLTAGALILSSHQLVYWKLGLMKRWISEGQHLSAFYLWLGYGLGACLIATLLVTLVEPTAGGSGIPDVKAYLNGNLLPHMLCFNAWFCRVVGLIFVTSSGLFAGTEGPMAHVGAITAAGIAMGRCSRLGCQLRLFSSLNNHQDKLEFISFGASVGVAAAFGAPIGGLLFSLEEASSFWTPQLTWRAFLAGCIASLMAKGTKTGFHHISVQGFIEFPEKDADWRAWELPIFILMGVSLGFLGALFCNCVRRLQQFRARVFKTGQPGKVRKHWRIIEALAITALTMVLTYTLAWVMPCSSGTANAISGEHARLLGSSHSSEEGFRLFSAFCPDPQTQASGVATVLLESREHAIKALFSKDFAIGRFEELHLLGLTVLIFALTVLTFGCSIPAGLFIPNIMLGACFGRLVGQLLQHLVPDAHPGIYAVIGAAGMLGGFSRMTVSLGVIIMEITHDIHLILPIMLAIMSAKLVGDCFTPSVYDIITALKNIPMLNPEEESLGWEKMSTLPVHICGTKRKDMEVVHLEQSFIVRDAMKILSATQHNAWPVLDPLSDGRLVGLLTRQKLLECLEEEKALPRVAARKDAGMAMVLEDWEGSPTTASSVLDIKRYMTTPFVMLQDTSLCLAYRTFRSMGLRHLCVVDDHHRLISFVTRTDFAEVIEEFTCPNVMKMRDFSEALVHEGTASLSTDKGAQCQADLTLCDETGAGAERSPGTRAYRRKERNFNQGVEASAGDM